MPSASLSYAHTGTPTLQVSDARGLLVRTVQFHRREANDPIDTRVTEQRFDAVGRPVSSRDPYLFNLAQTDAATPFNLSQVTSLSGVALLTDSVDAGWRVALLGASGQGLERWDGRGSHSQTEYDELLRAVAVNERGHEVPEHTLERFNYADASAEMAARNLCGQMIHHYDPAGTVQVLDLGLSGNVLNHTRRFLLSTDEPDWPPYGADCEALLEPGDGATTLNAFTASGEPLSQTDAQGNRQAFAYTVDGQLKNTRLTLAGADQTEKLLVRELDYDASGRLTSEIAGNGVITGHCYDEANGQLTELSAHKADGTPLQHLEYQYDAAGNVLSIEDAAQPIRYFNNQRIEPIRTYRYDTLSQLIEATGCEAKIGGNGPALPGLQPLPPDPSQIANYAQTFHYDAGGNLLDLVHVGAQAQGRTLTRARYSNRCLPERDGRPPTQEELANGFDNNGNLCELQPGQLLSWDLRNQLREVRPVVRDEVQDDGECYVYDGGGQRVRKVHSSQTNTRTLLREVRYLPGVEIRSHSGTGEILHVITASAGSNSVRVLHWASTPPDEIAQDQVRYSLTDQVKSCAVELDQQANVISWELFYAFGGTSLWAGRNAVEAKYKTVRYSGKERDATGLYYYGFRYYAPWLQRWINPDPAGPVDGLNFYRFVRNNPISLYDPNGLSPEGRLARRMMSETDFVEFYAQDPENALGTLKIIYQEEPLETLELALKRVKEQMTKPKPNEQKAALPAKEVQQTKYENINEFKAAFATTYGSHAINKMMRTGEYSSLDGTKIIKELSSRQGDQEFSGRSGKEAASNIKAFANIFTRAEAEKASNHLYHQANASTRNYYRGQRTTMAALDDYITAKEEGTVIYSPGFLSVAIDKGTAEEFMRADNTVLFIIEGFSAANVTSSYSASTVKTRVFTPHARFIVTGVWARENKDGQYVIKLKEVRNHTGNPIRMPY